MQTISVRFAKTHFFTLSLKILKPLKKGGKQMDKQDLKKILTGISVASLLAGASIGCTTQQPQQPAPPSKETAPAQRQETPAPGKEVPAPSS